MSISLHERLYLMWLSIPVANMGKTLSLAQHNGLGITLKELTAHHRAGGDIEALVNGLLFAREHGIPINWQQAAAIDLARSSTGKSLPEVLAVCVEPQSYTFNTFSPGDSEPLAGFTRDGTRVAAACTVRYRLMPQHVFGLTMEREHERLAVRIAVLVNKAPDPDRLEMARSQHEQTLLSLCAEAGVQEVSLQYRRT